MLTSRIIIQNRMTKPMQFQIEPDGFLFEIPEGTRAEINGNYEIEPDNGPVFR